MLISVISLVQVDSHKVNEVFELNDDKYFEFISPFVSQPLTSKNTKTVKVIGSAETIDESFDYAVANGDYLIVLKDSNGIADLNQCIKSAGLFDVYEAGSTSILSKILLRQFFKKQDLPLKSRVSMFSRRALSVAREGGEMRYSVHSQLYKTNFRFRTEVDILKKPPTNKELKNLFKLLLFHTDFFPKIVKFFVYISWFFVSVFGVYVLTRFLNNKTVEGWPSIVFTLLLIQASLSFYFLLLFKYIKHMFADRNKGVNVADYTLL